MKNKLSSLTIIAVAFVLVLSNAALAESISVDKAVELGKGYLATKYNVPSSQVNYVKSDSGGIQYKEVETGWNIWYFPVKTGKTQTHIVFVSYSGNEVRELYEDIDPKITKEEALSKIKEGLINQGVASSDTELKVRNFGVSRIMGGTTKEGNKEVVSSTGDTNYYPFYEGWIYFRAPKQPAQTTSYEEWYASVNGVSGAIEKLEQKNLCNFSNVKSEEDAIDRVKEKTSSSIQNAFMMNCFWVVSVSNGEYFVYDDGRVEFAPPLTGSVEPYAPDSATKFSEKSITLIGVIVLIIITAFLIKKFRT